MNEIDHSGKVFFGADGHLDRHRAAPEGLLDRLHGAPEIRALAIELVHHEHARKLVFFRPFPRLFRLHLHARDAAHQNRSGIHRTQRRPRICNKISVTGSVQKVDLHLVPFDVTRGRRDRDFPFNFIFIEIGNRGPLVHLAEAVDRSGVEQETGRQ